MTIKSKQTYPEKIFDMLRDGEPHHMEEIREKLFDKLTDNGTIRVHVCKVRKMLNPGELLICQYHNRCLWYRIVRSYK